MKLSQSSLLPTIRETPIKADLSLTSFKRNNRDFYDLGDFDIDMMWLILIDYIKI